VQLVLDHSLTAFALYALATVAWLVVWRAANGYELMRRVPLLWMPFLLAVVFLVANGGTALLFDAVGSAEYEESRFAFIEGRASIAVQAVAAILIVATIVYGLTIRRLPVDFIRFMVYAVIAILGVMAPILWIPDGAAAGFFVLRHFQNVALLFGLFLCVGAIILMLDDLLTHGEARVVLDPQEEAALTGAADEGTAQEEIGDEGEASAADGDAADGDAADGEATPRRGLMRPPFLRGPIG